MYLPRHFANDYQEPVHNRIAENTLATLVAKLEGNLETTHVPCALDRVQVLRADHPPVG